eukprot:CAMPEP_0202500128 /NCGR_PEP_ID=MMETSP1361-20130828/32038_1 /ASSEMBLY_ACC=CAM_ASM_000849 /TAXON_ID=210615 /ORGANISM="Staurosira complex sp., Strain CCMP2646" /LENGTH=361 /DNA_ID=CAMNT_0049132493 /DNA_START=29 /DNA_END=1114 /DNA_ORIENTATION=-
MSVIKSGIIKKPARGYGVLWMLLLLLGSSCLFVALSFQSPGKLVGAFVPITASSVASRCNTIIEYPLPDHPVHVPNATCSQAAGRSIMPLHRVHHVVQEMHQQDYALARRPHFNAIGQGLLQEAVQANQMLLTVQIGGMDGKSNDPMYAQFVQPEVISSLKHWMPVVVEPVPDNFQALTETYKRISASKGLLCPLLIQGAISYGPSRTCTFCRFDTSETAPDECNKHPDWMKYQIGTLDCDQSQRFFQDNFEKCIVQDSIICGSIATLLQEQVQLPSSNIAMLQLDVEGYEYEIISGLLDDLDDHSLPPVIHFENKVMREQDIKKNGTTALDANTFLRSRGYILYDRGEDTLALRASISSY